MESNTLNTKPSPIWTVLFGLSLVVFPLTAIRLWNSIPLLRNGDETALAVMPWALTSLTSFLTAVISGVFVIPWLMKGRKT